MYGPEFTFLGVPRCDLTDQESFAGSDVVIVGAPFDGGTSHRPGTRFGPSAIRQACYLPHDGSRPSLAMRVDGLQDLRVLDAGDVEMPPGDIEVSLRRLAQAVETVRAAGICLQRGAGPKTARYLARKGFSVDAIESACAEGIAEEDTSAVR